jgi:prolycopene isomerase
VFSRGIIDEAGIKKGDNSGGVVYMARKIVVIGSGIGGSGCGALLAKEQHEVTLIESHPFAGGRCASLDREGFRYDFGVHMFSRGEKGPLGEIDRRLDGDLKWVTHEIPCRVMGRVEFDFPLDINPLRRQIYLARKLGVKTKNYLGAFRLFRSLMSGREVEENDEVILQDYVSRYTDDEIIHLFINCLSQLYFAQSYRQSSAGEFLWCFSRMFKGASFGYPVGGGGEIPESYVKRMEGFGGRAVFNEEVQNVVVEGGRVRAVVTDKGEYPADLVVSNVGLRNSIYLAGRESFPEYYAETAESCSDSNAYITIKYALERPVVDAPVVFYMPHLPPEDVFTYIEDERPPDEPYIFMPVPTNHDPKLAPEGKQLVIAGTAAPAGASDQLSNAILDKVHGKVCELFPDLEEALVWMSRSTDSDARELTGHRAGEAIGLAQVPGQVGKMRPELRTPVEGFWLVGADAGARGIGTEMAAGSALYLADLIASME